MGSPGPGLDIRLDIGPLHEPPDTVEHNEREHESDSSREYIQDEGQSEPAPSCL